MEELVQSRVYHAVRRRQQGWYLRSSIQRWCHVKRLRTSVILPALVAASALTGIAVEPAVAQSGCLAPNDTSARIVNYVTFLLTDTTQATMRARDSLGIAGVQPNQISSVTDSRTCSKIVTFFDHFEGVTRSGRRVYAYSIGTTRFVAQDPNFKSGQWTPLMFVDQTYKLVQSHMVF